MENLFAILKVLLLLASSAYSQQRQITFNNQCGQDVWVSPLTNGNGQPLPDGNNGIVQVSSSGGSYTYNIPENGWAGRFWPKIGCDGSGQNCAFGQSTPPCPDGGCQPPADTKVEFNFPAEGSQDSIWYDVSLVDGYSLATEIVPSEQAGTCVTTNCNLSFDACPQNENDVGDLRVIDQNSGQVVGCLSPCKKWNYPNPYGMGNSEFNDPGLHYCCPTPPVSFSDCRAGPVESTQYVNLIHSSCPSAYSYAYDDVNGLHTCQSDVSFTVTFCP